MKISPVHHVHVKRDDGSIVLFPVSRNVLSFKQQSQTRATPEVAPLRHSFFSWRRKALSSTVSLLLVAITFGGSPVVLGSTLAYFRDDEVSRNNMFAAASLGFDLNPGEVTVDIMAGESVFISPKFTPETDTLPITYRISAEVVGEHTPLCSQLMANGTTSPILYNGQLTSLITEPATEAGLAHFEVTLPVAEGVAPDSECTVDIVYRGWHTDSPENTGYTDEEADRFTFVYRAQEETEPEELRAETQTDAAPQEPADSETPPAEPPVSEESSSPEDSGASTVEEAPEEPAPLEEPVVQNFSPSGGAPAETARENTSPSEPTTEDVPEETSETSPSGDTPTEPSIEESAPPEVPAPPVPEPVPVADVPPPSESPPATE